MRASWLVPTGQGLTTVSGGARARMPSDLAERLCSISGGPVAKPLAWCSVEPLMSLRIRGSY